MQARGYREFPQHFPQPGWVEHAPDRIWTAALDAARDALDAAPSDTYLCRHHQPARDGRPVGPGDARAHRVQPSSGRTGARPGCASSFDRTVTSALVAEHHGASPRPLLLGHEAGVDPDQRATHLGRSHRGTDGGRHRRLLPGRAYEPAASTTSPTRRTRRAPCCSTSTAARGPLSCASCSASRSTRCPTSSRPTAISRAPTRCAFSGLDLPITGIAGDQQAALFGQSAFDAGRRQVHLRHRIVRAGQHRDRSRQLARRACSPRSPSARLTAR